MATRSAGVPSSARGPADLQYQQQVWIHRHYPEEGYCDDLTENLNMLFDDAAILPNPRSRVGVPVYGSEVSVLEFLGAVLDEMIKDSGEASDSTYLEDPRWPVVNAKAAEAVAVLEESDRHARE